MVTKKKEDVTDKQKENECVKKRWRDHGFVTFGSSKHRSTQAYHVVFVW